ncbi:mitochondrial carrier protein [Niveomyces insectorum RCEF 264]|uniref:Mitochondrial carrier protein n=1 Tax=Niveomyces insectorum RCEF 264 TaxID=1081102 RepID=A0A167XXL5_9HYPO|nr:mitochondrial carrier protein [Niveomyces insectorum RCEF 264]
MQAGIVTTTLYPSVTAGAGDDAAADARLIQPSSAAATTATATTTSPTTSFTLVSPTTSPAPITTALVPNRPRPHTMRVELQVGERRFTTTRDTLVGESQFFAVLLSGRWENVLGDDAYFVDADPALFEHILRYLRRSVFPLFYDQTRGHDYALYNALLAEARYFQIARLESYLADKEYLKAVEVKRTVTVCDGEENLPQHNGTLPADTVVEYHPSWDIQEVYLCPREIPVHRGRPDRCGKDCKRAQGEAEPEYEEEPYLRMLVVEKTVVFHPEPWSKPPGILPAVPGADAVPVIPDKDRRTNAATAASAASVRALSAQALQFYFRAPVKAFFRTRVDYLAYARAADGSLSGFSAPASEAAPPAASTPAASTHNHRVRTWLRGTTPGVLARAIRHAGWSVVPDQVLPPLLANVGVAAVLYTSYLQILGRLHPESGQARRRVYPPPAPTQTFVAGFLAGSVQSIVAAPLDAIQARYDHRAVAASGPNGTGSPRSMWAFSAAKLREIGLRGIFAGWGLSFVKDSFGNGVFFSVFEYVKAQSYYRFVAYYYGALDGSTVLAQQQRPTEARARRQSVNDASTGRDGLSAPLVIRPHYTLEPMFLLFAGVGASFAQQVLLHPLTHFQVEHWDLLEDLDAAAKTERQAAAAAKANGTAGSGGGNNFSSTGSRFPNVRLRWPRFHIVRTYYHAYLRTWARCSELAAADGHRSRLAWLYRGFWWNAIRQVPSTSAGLIIFELLRRKYGMAGEGVRISQDGYDILLT